MINYYNVQEQQSMKVLPEFKPVLKVTKQRCSIYIQMHVVLYVMILINKCLIINISGGVTEKLCITIIVTKTLCIF